MSNEFYTVYQEKDFIHALRDMHAKGEQLANIEHLMTIANYEDMFDSSLEELTNNHSILSRDGIVFDGTGNFKLDLDSKILGGFDQFVHPEELVNYGDIDLSGTSLPHYGELPKNFDGTEFKLEFDELAGLEFYKLEEAIGNTIWKVLARGKDALLKDYARLIFSDYDVNDDSGVMHTPYYAAEGRNLESMLALKPKTGSIILGRPFDEKYLSNDYGEKRVTLIGVKPNFERFLGYTFPVSVEAKRIFDMRK